MNKYGINRLLILFVLFANNFSMLAQQLSIVEVIELWPSSSFTPPQQSLRKAHQIEGNITFKSSALMELQIISDKQYFVDKSKNNVLSLPLLSLDFISSNGFIIPTKRGVQKSKHPHWEYLFEPGRVWQVSKQWSKASLPFALSERNANCTHNGVIDFLYNENGSIKDSRIQIASETCGYLKFNLQGKLETLFASKKITNKSLLLSAYQQERSNRTPVNSIEELTKTYPKLDIHNLKPFDVKNTTNYGFFIDQKYYASDCPTRSGNYPFCEHLALPSFSLAKTIFAGLSFLYIDNRYEDFATTKVIKYIPECNSNQWQNVTIEHLINMRSGHFTSSTFMSDEASDDIEEFFLSETAKEKIKFSCNEYPYQEEPGKTWVYHTSDHFLAGVFMTRFMRGKTQNIKYDLFRDLLHQEILLPLNVSPLLSDSKRTYDQYSEPFVGWGLTLLADDLVKISRFINAFRDNDESSKLFDHSKLQEILSERDLQQGTQDINYLYEMGFWRLNLLKSKLCKDNKWLTFMSGYGGISVVLFPEKMFYFSFTDGYQFNWKHVAVELNRLHPYCENIY